MSQFDVYVNRGSREYPFVIDLQADLLRDLATRVVAPLVPAQKLGGGRITVLNPTIDLEGKSYVVLMPEAAAVPYSALGPIRANFAHRRSEFIAAVDLIFTGI